VKRERFERQCLKWSGGTLAELREFHEIVPCGCGERGCPGWKAVYKLRNRRRREESA